MSRYAVHACLDTLCACLSNCGACLSTGVVRGSSGSGAASTGTASALMPPPPPPASTTARGPGKACHLVTRHQQTPQNLVYTATS